MNSNNDTLIAVASTTFVFGMALGVMVVSHFSEQYFHIPKQDWKCEKTVIVNDDITQVECVNYIKKEK